jgi:hypothetical protein
MPNLKHLREELDELGVEPSTPTGSSPQCGLLTLVLREATLQLRGVEFSRILKRRLVMLAADNEFIPVYQTLREETER